MVLKAEGKVHSLTVRDVQLNEAGQVKLTAKDFQTEANLIVRGKMTTSADSTADSTDRLFVVVPESQLRSGFKA